MTWDEFGALLVNLNWGDVPGWVQASTSLLALIGAVIAVRQSWRVLSIERRRDEADARREILSLQNEVASQARLVSAWWERSSGNKITVLVANRSDLPVYRVNIAVTIGSDDPALIEQDVLAPHADAHRFDLLRTGTDARLEMEFVDAGGRRWSRGPDGALHQPGTDVDAETRTPE